MKILICGSAIQQLSMEKLYAIEQSEVDLCIMLGNLEEETIENIRFCLPDGVQTLYVLGNKDKFETWNKEDAQHIHGFMVPYSCNNIKFTGFMGSPNNTVGYTQEESLYLCNKLPAADVLITHDAGFHMLDDWKQNNSEGFAGITEYINKNRPKYHIFGHYDKNYDFQYPKRKPFKKEHLTQEICIAECAILDYDTGNLINI